MKNETCRRLYFVSYGNMHASKIRQLLRLEMVVTGTTDFLHWSCSAFAWSKNPFDNINSTCVTDLYGKVLLYWRNCHSEKRKKIWKKILQKKAVISVLWFLRLTSAGSCFTTTTQHRTYTLVRHFYLKSIAARQSTHFLKKFDNNVWKKKFWKKMSLKIFSSTASYKCKVSEKFPATLQ